MDKHNIYGRPRHFKQMVEEFLITIKHIINNNSQHLNVS